MFETVVTLPFSFSSFPFHAGKWRRRHACCCGELDAGTRAAVTNGGASWLKLVTNLLPALSPSSELRALRRPAGRCLRGLYCPLPLAAFESAAASPVAAHSAAAAAAEAAAPRALELRGKPGQSSGQQPVGLTAVRCLTDPLEQTGLPPFPHSRRHADGRDSEDQGQCARGRAGLHRLRPRCTKLDPPLIFGAIWLRDHGAQHQHVLHAAILFQLQHHQWSLTCASAANAGLGTSREDFHRDE